MLESERTTAADTALARRLIRTPKAILVRRARISPLGIKHERWTPAQDEAVTEHWERFNEFCASIGRTVSPRHGTRRVPREAPGGGLMPQPFRGLYAKARKPGESYRIINRNITDDDRRRRQIRREIEDMEEAIRFRRMYEDADW